MNRVPVIAAAFAVMLAVTSCAKGSDTYTLSDRDHSGFGHVSGLFKDGAELLFSIDSDKAGTVDMTVRCMCLFDYDLESLSVLTEYETLPVRMTETGKWCTVQVPVKLEKGTNRIFFRKTRPLKSDIYIDYIEY